MYDKISSVFTCMLSAAGQWEAALPHCAENATLPGRVNHIQLAAS